MTSSGSLKVTASSDLEIAMTRVFDAPRHLVFEALTTPALLKRWLLGTPGWVLDVCTVEPRVGGSYRYEWLKESTGKRMGSSGRFLEFMPPGRTVATERFDEAWYDGEAIVTTVLEEYEGKTTLTLTLRHISKEVRDKVLQSGMERGVDMSYDRLAQLLAEVSA